MKKIEIIVRMVLGIVLVVFGLDKFLAFVPHSHVMTDELIAAYQGLLANKFILPTVGVVELIAGVLLIWGRYIILALMALAPIVFGILAFHFAVDLHGILPGIGVTALYIYLVIYRRKVLAELLKHTRAI
jgi:uncharacterized membrane protein YphA (DoxX/SURF4 family)